MSPLHVMSTSCSLCTLTPPFVKMEIVPSLDVLPTLMKELAKLVKVSAIEACCESCLNGSLVMFCSLLILPFATPTLLSDLHSMGSLALILSLSNR